MGVLRRELWKQQTIQFRPLSRCRRPNNLQRSKPCISSSKRLRSNRLCTCNKRNKPSRRPMEQRMVRQQQVLSTPDRTDRRNDPEILPQRMKITSDECDTDLSTEQK